jgi:phosphatidylglycerophosphatase A
VCGRGVGAVLNAVEEREGNAMDKRLVRFLHKAGASVLFLGYFPVASGTVGSAAAILFVLAIKHYFPLVLAPESVTVYWMAMVGGVGVSIALSSRATENFGSTDPHQVVVDEFIGQLITFFMLPITWRVLVLGFLLFRFYDIIKPFPVHTMEELEGGVGVTMDDVIAGIYANVTLALILFSYNMVRAAL